MCGTLSELRAAMEQFTTAFDAHVVLDLDAVVRDAAAIEGMAVTVKALAAAVAADRGTWRGRGQRSAAADLASATGTSVGAARDLLDTGRHLADQPAVADAARTGTLSPSQATLIADAVADNPDAATDLLSGAATDSLGELRDKCARAKAAADPSPEERRRRIHARRCLRSFTDAGGVAHLAARGNPEDVARIIAALDPLRERLFAAARAEGRRESPDAYAFDALVALATSGPAARGSGGAKILVRVDLEALLRGYPLDSEACEMAGFGPIAPSAIRDLIDTADPFLVAIATKGRAVVGVAHLGRRARAHQQSALEWLYPVCAAEGCNAVAGLQNDHRLDWSKVHFTVFDLLDRLCVHHHNQKTRDNWALVEGRGKRAFVAPDDPRHPDYRRRRRPAAVP